MAFLFRLLLIGLTCLNSTETFADRRSDMSQLRYHSFIILDRQPTPQEAQTFYRGEKNLDQMVADWLASSEHLKRIERYFRDLLGAHQFFFIADEAFFLKLSPEGHYYSEQKGNCQANEIVERPAWWAESRSEVVRICSNVVSDNLFITVNDTYYGCTWADGFLREGCGCGPEQILCYPESMRLGLMDDLAQEFPQRAVYVYEHNLSWYDLLAAPYIYGNRGMYLFYLQNQFIIPWQASPNEDQIAAIYQIPLHEKSWVMTPFQGAARSGIVTNPAFMRRFNNFRSRIRALTDALLCREVDGSLNTDGIQHLANPDVSEFDMQIVGRESCATCHLGMDNMGAHIFGWNDQGTYQRWPQELSQIGHAFGVSGTGPEDLMLGFLENGPGFIECMTKKSWEDFSGHSWNVLGAAEMQQLASDGSLGPRYLIQAILNSPSLLSARLGQGTSSTENPDDSIDFASQVNPILSASCSGSSCHGSDSLLGNRYQFVDNEAGFRGAPIERLDDGSMPPVSSGLKLESSQRELLIRYLKSYQQ